MNLNQSSPALRLLSPSLISFCCLLLFADPKGVSSSFLPTLIPDPIHFITGTIDQFCQMLERVHPKLDARGAPPTALFSSQILLTRSYRLLAHRSTAASGGGLIAPPSSSQQQQSFIAYDYNPFSPPLSAHMTPLSHVLPSLLLPHTNRPSSITACFDSTMGSAVQLWISIIRWKEAIIRKEEHLAKIAATEEEAAKKQKEKDAANSHAMSDSTSSTSSSSASAAAATSESKKSSSADTAMTDSVSTQPTGPAVPPAPPAPAKPSYSDTVARVIAVRTVMALEDLSTSLDGSAHCSQSAHVLTYTLAGFLDTMPSLRAGLSNDPVIGALLARLQLLTAAIAKTLSHVPWSPAAPPALSGPNPAMLAIALGPNGMDLSDSAFERKALNSTSASAAAVATTSANKPTESDTQRAERKKLRRLAESECCSVLYLLNTLLNTHGTYTPPQLPSGFGPALLTGSLPASSPTGAALSGANSNSSSSAAAAAAPTPSPRLAPLVPPKTPTLTSIQATPYAVNPPTRFAVSPFAAAAPALPPALLTFSVLDESQRKSLLESVLSLISNQLTLPDLITSCLSALVRLTRNHALASTFLQMDGVQRLLALRISRSSEGDARMTQWPTAISAILRNCVEDATVLLTAFEHDIKLVLSSQPAPSPPSRASDANDPAYDKYWMDASKFVRLFAPCMARNAAVFRVALLNTTVVESVSRWPKYYGSAAGQKSTTTRVRLREDCHPPPAPGSAEAKAKATGASSSSSSDVKMSFADARESKESVSRQNAASSSEKKDHSDREEKVSVKLLSTPIKRKRLGVTDAVPPLSLKSSSSAAQPRRDTVSSTNMALLTTLLNAVAKEIADSKMKFIARKRQSKSEKAGSTPTVAPANPTANGNASSSTASASASAAPAPATAAASTPRVDSKSGASATAAATTTATATTVASTASSSSDAAAKASEAKASEAKVSANLSLFLSGKVPVVRGSDILKFLRELVDVHPVFAKFILHFETGTTTTTASTPANHTSSNSAGSATTPAAMEISAAGSKHTTSAPVVVLPPPAHARSRTVPPAVNTNAAPIVANRPPPAASTRLAMLASPAASPQASPPSSAPGTPHFGSSHGAMLPPPIAAPSPNSLVSVLILSLTDTEHQWTNTDDICNFLFGLAAASPKEGARRVLACLLDILTAQTGQKPAAGVDPTSLGRAISAPSGSGSPPVFAAGSTGTIKQQQSLLSFFSTSLSGASSTAAPAAAAASTVKPAVVKSKQSSKAMKAMVAAAYTTAHAIESLLTSDATHRRAFCRQLVASDGLQVLANTLEWLNLNVVPKSSMRVIKAVLKALELILKQDAATPLMATKAEDKHAESEADKWRSALAERRKARRAALLARRRANELGPSDLFGEEPPVAPGGEAAAASGSGDGSAAAAAAGAAGSGAEIELEMAVPAGAAAAAAAPSEPAPSSARRANSRAARARALVRSLLRCIT